MICVCGSEAFYLDRDRGDVCRICGRDELRHEAGEHELLNPYRQNALKRDHALVKECANPPQETDCPNCLFPAEHNHKCRGDDY